MKVPHLPGLGTSWTVMSPRRLPEVLFFHVGCCESKDGEEWETGVIGPTSIIELGYGTGSANVLLDHFKSRLLVPSLWESGVVA